MTWPFENDTSAITKKLAKKSMRSEKRRNLMVIIAVALAAFLICFAGTASVSLAQIQRSQVADTYEAVWQGIDEAELEILKDQPEFARVGGYYLLGQEPAGQGYTASYVYMDKEMMDTARGQMKLLTGRVPEKANEAAVSKYFLSAYGNHAGIGDTVVLDTESFHGDYIVTGIMDSAGEKETNTCPFVLSKAALTKWAGFDTAGYRAYVHFENDTKLGEAAMTASCREITEKYGLPPVGMNDRYFAYYKKTIDFTAVGGIALLVLIGGYVVIQSIFRISVNDKIQSFGQLRMIGATRKQIKQIVKREGRKLGSIGTLIGTVLGVSGSFLLFPKGFHALYNTLAAVLAAAVCWIMVSIAIRKPMKIASGISPVEAVRFLPEPDAVHRRRKHSRLNPVSMGIANFMRDCKKTTAIVASLSLGGICLLIIASALLTRSPRQYARQFFPDGDYEIYLDSEKSEIELMTGGNPLGARLKEEILSIDGVTDIIEKREAFIGKAAVSEATPVASMCDILDEGNEQEAELALVKGSMPADKDEILIAESVYKYFGRSADIKIGQTLELTVEQKTVSVTLAGIFDTKQVTNGHGSLAMDSTQVFLSRDLAQGLFPEIENFDYSWNIVSDPQKAQSVEAGLKSVAVNHRDLALWTFAESLEYEEIQSRIMFGSMQALSWLVFLFGVINLINTTLSNQISRKRESSILRSIGLTGKQLCKMNICEGLCYAFFTILTVLIAGIPIAAAVSVRISKIAFAGKVVPYQFPVLEMGLFILALFAVELLLSVWMVHRQKKQSLIEQMRALS